MYRGQASVSTSYLQFIPQSIKGGDRGEDDDDVGSRFVWNVHVVVAGGFLFFFTLFKNAAEESFPGFDQSPKSWLQSLQGGIRIEIHELLVREHVI